MKPPSEKDQSLLVKMIIAVIAIWLLSAILILYFLDNWQNRGTFGDLFGAVNALFSGLAFVGLIYAVVLQKQDLELQKSEIRLNREELKKSSNAQTASQQALTEQVVQMRMAAKLNALNTLVNYYSSQITNGQNSPEEILRSKKKRKEAIKEIDILIDRETEEELD